MQVKEPVLTKRQINELFSQLYKEVSRKQVAVCDGVTNSLLKEDLFKQYDVVRSLVRQASDKLTLCGGFD